MRIKLQPEGGEAAVSRPVAVFFLGCQWNKGPRAQEGQFTRALVGPRLSSLLVRTAVCWLKEVPGFHQMYWLSRVWPRLRCLLWNEKSDIQRKRTWVVMLIPIKWGEYTKRPLRPIQVSTVPTLNCLLGGKIPGKWEGWGVWVPAEDRRNRTRRRPVPSFPGSCLYPDSLLCCSPPAGTAGFLISIKMRSFNIFTGRGLGTSWNRFQVLNQVCARPRRITWRFCLFRDYVQKWSVIIKREKCRDRALEARTLFCGIGMASTTELQGLQLGGRALSPLTHLTRSSSGGRVSREPT